MIFQDGGNVDIDLRHLVGELLRYFLREVVLNLRLLGQLLLLMVLCSCLEHLQVSGSRKAPVTWYRRLLFALLFCRQELSGYH